MNEWKKLALQTAELTLRNTREHLNRLTDESNIPTPEALKDVLERIKELEVSYYALHRELKALKEVRI